MELDGEMYDARYSIGFCYEEFGEYGKAYDMWLEIAHNLEEDGFKHLCCRPYMDWAL